MLVHIPKGHSQAQVAHACHRPSRWVAGKDEQPCKKVMAGTPRRLKPDPSLMSAWGSTNLQALHTCTLAAGEGSFQPLACQPYRAEVESQSQRWEVMGAHLWQRQARHQHILCVGLSTG